MSDLKFLLFLKDKNRIERLKELLKFDEMKATALLLPKTEEDWCSFHNLVQSSLKHVSEMCTLALLLYRYSVLSVNNLQFL